MWTTNHQTSGENNSERRHANNMCLMKKRKRGRAIEATWSLCRCFLLAFVLLNRLTHGYKCGQEKKKRMSDLYLYHVESFTLQIPHMSISSSNISWMCCPYHITSKKPSTSSFVSISQIPASCRQSNKDRAGSYHRYITAQYRQNSTNTVMLALPPLVRLRGREKKFYKMGMCHYITMKMLRGKKSCWKTKIKQDKPWKCIHGDMETLWVLIHCEATEVVTLYEKWMNTTTILKSQNVTGAKQQARHKG